MSRATQRWLAFAGAGLRRLGTRLSRALLVDESVAREEAAAERAAAHELADRAAVLRGGVAKAAQLQAYFEGPGLSADAGARATLAVLWDHAPADEPAAIRRVIEEDLGAPPEQRFATWDARPLAAASLGQVHAATAGDGARLAVKVQYPAVAAALRDDVTSNRLVRRLAGAGLGGGLSPEAVAALARSLLGELDYRAEGRHLEAFGAAYAGDATIVIPRFYPALSSGRVLTMERLEGASLAALAASGSAAERSAVAATLFRFAFGAPLRHGLLNADPNPGNYLALDAAAGRVGFLDFGCCEAVPAALREADRDLWYAMVVRDGERLRHAVHRQGLLGDAKVLDTSTFRAWEASLAGPFLARGPRALRAEDVRELARLTSQMVRSHGMALPPAALMLWRQRLGALSVIAHLAPELDFRLALCGLLDDGHHPVPLAQRYP
jgi:predicted unusual protein kinase regulating ubiquinone biosynthesis (AarF/ABC1/UbiB family)